MGAAVVLDPGIMVLRLGRTSAEETYAVVESLLAWAGLLDEDWVTVLPSKRAAEALAGDDLYPGRHDLTEAFDAYGVIEYSVNDVMHVMDRFLSMAPWFEEHCRVEYVWLDEEEVATQPDVLGVTAGPCLREELARCMATIAVLQRYCGVGGWEYVVALREAPQDVVEISARIHDWEHSRHELEDVEVPEIVVGAIATCQNVHGLIDRVDECALLQRASDDNIAHLALRVAVFKARRARGGDTDWWATGSWRIGRRFREGVRRCSRGAGQDFVRKLLRAASEAVDGVNQREEHPLRTGHSGNNPQQRRRRDRAQAWRRKIDDEYRLHYWRVEGSDAELSWVGPHNDYSIPD